MTPSDPKNNPPNGAPEPSEGATASGELAKLQAEKNELLQTLMLRQADFENYRKRIERDRHEETRRGIGRVLEDLLPVLDGFERALASRPEDAASADHHKGFELIHKQLWDALSRHGLTRIEAEGKYFDPHVHLAVERVETADRPDGTVLEVLQQGYKFHNRVLRPTAVRVAVHPSGHADGDESNSRKTHAAD